MTVEDFLKSRRVATYSSFVVHLLTGWLPTSPWSMSGLLTKNPTQLSTLIDQIVSGALQKLHLTTSLLVISWCKAMKTAV